tara:strand:- start:26106 stop:27257 length:1152 start_codon:yes stop_codon:yes gene_type:complete
MNGIHLGVLKMSEKSEILNEEENIEISEETTEETETAETTETETETETVEEVTEVAEVEISELEEETTETEVEETGAVLENLLETLPTSKSGMVQTINSMLAEMTKDELQFKVKHLVEVLTATEKEILEREGGLNLTDIELSDDVNQLFEGEEFDVNFRRKATLLFETAVAKRVEEVQGNIEENFKQDMEEQVLDYKEKLSEAVDKLLNASIEDWQDDNKLAIHSGLKSEITEEFMSGLKTLFKENYIDIPEDKENEYVNLKEIHDNTSIKLNDEIEKNIELKSTIHEQKREILFWENTQDLTTVEREKLQKLAEKIEFDNDEEYVEGLETIRKCYFSEKEESTTEENTEIEEVETLQVVAETTEKPKTKIERYAQDLGKYWK